MRLCCHLPEVDGVEQRSWLNESSTCCMARAASLCVPKIDRTNDDDDDDEFVVANLLPLGALILLVGRPRSVVVMQMNYHGATNKYES